MEENPATSNQFEKYLAKLSNRLTPLYQPQAMGVGGHDVTHVLRMLGMEEEIAELLDFDTHEYQAAVWLHNADRSPQLLESFPGASLEAVLHKLLEPSPFDDATRSRITNAVLEHGKRDDGPNDSALLRGLRLADKWDRIGPFGVIGGSAFRGSRLLPYDPADPFGYDSTAEGRMKTLYHDFFRILEWYAEFPLIRRLAKKHPERMRLFLDFVRAFGSEMAERHHIKSLVEEDIKKALGPYYDEWHPGR